MILFAATAVMTVAVNADPIVDGSYDAQYGSPLAVQNTQTQFGDATTGLIDYCGGSELDGIYAYRTATDLYLFLPGNLESNYNKLEIFIDSRAGGQNRLDGTQPSTDFEALARMAGTGVGDGLTFDSGFEADFWFSQTGGDNGGVYAMYANYGEINTTNGAYLGTTTATVGTLTGSTDLGCQATINNSNVLGVDGGTGTSSGAGVTTGMEWKIPLSNIGNPTGAIKVCAFINGSGHDYLSNQVLGGIGGGSNFGEPRAVNFSTVPGDQFVVVPGTAPTISGTVAFSDFDGTTPSSGTFEIRDSTNSTLLSTQTVAITAGAYTVDAPGNGNYIVSYKGGFWLRKNVAVNTTSGNATGANLSLTNGDLDNDNEIGIGDYGILSSLYGSENAAGDINGDGSVDIGDYAVLSANYGLLGDE